MLFTQWHRNFPRTNQRRFPILLSFTESQLGFRFRQRWVFKTQFSTSLVLGRARAHSLIQDIGGTLRSNTSDVDGSEGALSNPESHTSGLPVVGGTGNLLPWRAGVRAH